EGGRAVGEEALDAGLNEPLRGWGQVAVAGARDGGHVGIVSRSCWSNARTAGVGWMVQVRRSCRALAMTRSEACARPVLRACNAPPPEAATRTCPAATP